MNKFILLQVIVTFIVVSCSTDVKRYDGYKVYSIHTQNNPMAFEVIKKLQQTTIVYDFWTEPSRHSPTDIMIPPENENQFVGFLKSKNLAFEIKISDVQRLMDLTEKADSRNQQQKFKSSSRYSHNWSTYSTLAQINEFVLEIASTYPNLVTLFNIGKSFNNSDMYMLKISTGSSPSKNSIFIDGGIHAREWISPATVTYIIKELVENNNAHPELTRNLDWFIVPILNPDGYQYSHTTDRLWRKNRKPSNALCIGTDLNRNAGFHWGEGGTSTNGCSDIYQGDAAFSEPESQNLRDVLNIAAANRTKCYLTFHSYGQDMLTPWSYQNSPLPDNYNQMYDLGIRATNALKNVSGTEYGVGNSYTLYGATAGSTDDWAKGGTPQIPFAYTVELRDQGKYGFLLPEDQILPTAVETWELVNVVARDVMMMLH